MAFRENVGKRHEAYGWQVIKVDDGNDRLAIGRAIEAAKADRSRPSMICQNTNRLRLSLAGQAQDTGEPLGEDNIAKTKAFGLTKQSSFRSSGQLTDYMPRLKQN